MTRIKICGLTNIRDAERAAECGADFLGVVFEPSSPRFAGEDSEFLQRISRVGPPVIAVFGPFAQDAVVPSGWTTQCFAPGPLAPYWQAIRPKHEFDSTMITEFASHIVLDTPSDSGYGGTGHRLASDLARSWVSSSPLPVILAGGLNPENARQAVAELSPWGVDVSSGVEARKGVKDHAKIRDFIAELRGG